MRRLARDDEAIFAATELCYEGHKSYDCRFPDRTPDAHVILLHCFAVLSFAPLLPAARNDVNMFNSNIRNSMKRRRLRLVRAERDACRTDV